MSPFRRGINISFKIYGSIPIINGLTDFCHPCQVLADLLTIREFKGRFDGLKMCYIGDGNNMANSLIVGGLKVGMEVSIACPNDYQPDKEVLDFAAQYGDKFEMTDSPEKAAKEGLPVDITKMFVFDSLDDVLRLSGILAKFYTGKNSLYKSPFDNKYYLVVSKSDDSAETYNKVCNILSEYSNQQNYVVGTDQYMSEHYEIMAEGDAVQKLAAI